MPFHSGGGGGGLKPPPLDLLGAAALGAGALTDALGGAGLGSADLGSAAGFFENNEEKPNPFLGSAALPAGAAGGGMPGGGGRLAGIGGGGKLLGGGGGGIDALAGGGGGGGAPVVEAGGADGTFVNGADVGAAVVGFLICSATMGADFTTGTVLLKLPDAGGFPASGYMSSSRILVPSSFAISWPFARCFFVVSCLSSLSTTP